MTAHWLHPDSYTDPRLGSTDVELLNAQAADAEQRVRDIYSVDLTIGFKGVAPQISMLINRGRPTEQSIDLAPQQIARLVPWLVFEGREAIQRARSHQQLAEHDVARWQLHRCPECGLGPYGPYTRSISQMLKLATEQGSMP